MYQLEYQYESSYAGITRRRSFFYRPEFIVDGALWKAVRQGNDISTGKDERKLDKLNSKMTEAERRKEE